MSITSLIRRAPRRMSALFAMIAAVIIVPAVLNAWGPDRVMFTMEKPAPYITFNSMWNPAHGDEKNFMQVRDAASGDRKYADTIELAPGKEYEIYMYYHNNAASNLGLVAINSTIRAQVPSTVKAGSNGTKAVGYIKADNAKHLDRTGKDNGNQVWDDIDFINKTNQDIKLYYIPGSATIHNKGKMNGATLSDQIIGSGAPLGYDELDGKLPGCEQYAGYVTFRIKTGKADFEMKKQVRKTDTTDWKESVAVKPGDKVDYLITYKNTGTTQQNNVIVKDVLPAGVSYVPGTTYLTNGSNPNGAKVSDGIVTDAGINIGHYAPGAAAYIRFTAQVDQNDKLPECGKNTLRNIGKVITDDGTKEDPADVTVDKECQPTPKFTCDKLVPHEITSTEYKFTTDYTVENATFKHITYVVRNASGTEVYRGENNTFSSTTPGAYTVEAILTVTIDGQDKTAPVGNCKASFTIPKEDEKQPEVTIDKKVNGAPHAKVEVGETFTYTLVVKNTGKVDLKNTRVTDNAPEHVEFLTADKGTITDNKWAYTIPEFKVNQTVTIKITAKVTKEVEGTIKNTACVDAPETPKNPDDCDDATVEVPPKTPPVTPTPEIQVCDKDTKTIITIEKDAFDKNKHLDAKDCIKACDTKTGTVVPVTRDQLGDRYTEDLTQCDLPTELPTTGLGSSIAATIGLGSLVASVSYYVISRRILGAL